MQSTSPGTTRPRPRAAGEEQCAKAVLMVRPASFGWNAETEASNAFQRAGRDPADAVAGAARAEFEAVVAALRGVGVVVHTFDDRPRPQCPDAVFPNNWVSFHADGTAVLYPMLAPNRRAERRRDLLLQLEREGGYELRRIVDLTHFESRGLFLEGTGSLVLDRGARTAYACLSPRTHLEPLHAFCDELGYELCVFIATDAAGVPVYHTNVVLSIGATVAVVAADSVPPSDRARLLERLADGERMVETIDRDQVTRFAGNVLELRTRSGAPVLAMSASAFESFSSTARARLASRIERVVTVPIPVIERHGGGSVRCMLAEVFLPAVEAA